MLTPCICQNAGAPGGSFIGLAAKVVALGAGAPSGHRRDRTAPALPFYWSASDLPMISTAVMFTSHGGNSFGVKKLSVRSG